MRHSGSTFMRAKMGLRDLPAKYQALIQAQVPQSKYKNRITPYNGVRYHSQREADYARELDWLVQAGQLKSWERQVRFPLVVQGKHIAVYVMDFVETDLAGNKTCVEVKGFWTDVAKIKRKLFESLYPELRYKVV